jgi:D-aminoacyl-tRNA deacylase
MKIALISSRQDPAGANISGEIRRILECGGPVRKDYRYELIEIGERLINAAHVDRETDASLIFFLSRHSSERPGKVLTVHATGNFREAALGGSPEALAPAAADWMHAILGELARYAPHEYRVSYEVTHHGPTELETPSLFVEIGSSREEWSDPVAADAVAKSVLAAAPTATLRAIGFGGTHYAKRQTEISLKSGTAFGHIAHSREVEFLTARMIAEMWEKTGAVVAYIDKKALPAAAVTRLAGILAAREIPVLGETELVRVSRISFETWQEVRGLAGVVRNDIHCHIHALPGPGIPVLITLDPALLRLTLGAGEAEFLSGLETLLVVHLSSPEGHVLPEFVTYEELAPQVLHDLISLCVSLLSIKQDASVEGDHLVIRRKRFDPGRAEELGVPKGPLYGRLMNGQEVEINGRVITPDMVRFCDIERIRIPGLERYV